MSSCKSDIVVSFIAGIITGAYISYSLDRFNSRQKPTTYFIKDPSSPFPIHSDEQEILVHGFKLRHTDRLVSDAKCLFVPSHWNFADIELRVIRNIHTDYFNTSLSSVCLIGHDLIACKGSLARLCQKYLTENDYQLYLPSSWPMETWETLYLQIREQKIHPETLLIVKTNLQRQTATFIYQAQHLPSPDDLRKEQAVVIQNLLSDALCIGGHKVTLRVYVLCFISASKRKLWRFSNGFIYYSSKPYKSHSCELDSQIASGYNDRSVYNGRPLTLHDLWKTFLDPISTRYSHDIDACLKSTIGTLIQRDDIIENVPQGSCQIFGCDIFLKDYDICSGHGSLAVLLEVNKAPDLTYKSERDGALKRSLIRKMWMLVTRPGLLEISRSANFENGLDEEEMEDTWLDII